MLWGCFCTKGTGKLHCIKRYDGRGHVPSGPGPLNPARALKMGRGWVFQHDIDQKHSQGNKGVAREEAH